MAARHLKLGEPALEQAGMPVLERPLALSASGFRPGPDLPLRTARVPRLGEHTQEILAEIGLEAPSNQEPHD